MVGELSHEFFSPLPPRPLSSTFTASCPWHRHAPTKSVVSDQQRKIRSRWRLALQRARLNDARATARAAPSA